MMGVLTLAARSCLQISMPLIPGRRRSTTIRSGLVERARSKPVFPSAASSGRKPSCSRRMAIVSRRLSSSSMTRMFGMRNNGYLLVCLDGSGVASRRQWADTIDEARCADAFIVRGCFDRDSGGGYARAGAIDSAAGPSAHDGSAAHNLDSAGRRPESSRFAERGELRRIEGESVSGPAGPAEVQKRQKGQERQGLV